MEVPTAPGQLQLPHAINSFVVFKNELLPQELRGRLLMPWAMSWRHLASLCCSKTSQRTPSRNPAPCWDLAAHSQPRGPDCAPSAWQQPQTAAAGARPLPCPGEAAEWWWLPGTGFPAALAFREHFGVGLTWCLSACTWVWGCTCDLCLWCAGGSGQGFASHYWKRL